MKKIETLKENVLTVLLILIIGGLTILITAQNVRNTAETDLKSNSVEVEAKVNTAYVIDLYDTEIKVINPDNNEVIFIDNYESKSGLSEAILRDNE